MHEEALIRDLRRKLEEIARSEGVDRILRVHVWVGALSHLSPETLSDRWPRLVEGTAAQGSALSIERSSDVADARAQEIILAKVDVRVDDAPARS